MNLNLPFCLLTMKKVREILKALQRLDLSQETIEDQSPVDLCSTLNVSVCDEKFPMVVQSPKPSAVDGTNGPDNLGNISKPFLCMREGCKYGAMTKESLFKHLVRVHDYTNDMIIKLKKGPAKFAPYCCHLCTKTFTRTTNLRIHCEGIHKLSRKEFAKHKVRFLSNKKADEDISESKFSNNLTRIYPSNSQKVWLSYATSHVISQEKLHSASELNAGHEQKAISQERVSDSSAKVQSASAANQCLERQLGGPAKKSVTIAASASHQVVPSRAVNSFPEKIAEVESPQKTKEKKEKNEIEDAFNPYRPYRCVHEGCMASFTIQQNLILHYKAVHQSALPKFGIHAEYDRREDVGQGGEVEIARSSEFHCRVQDCSRIFPQVGSLVQHYLQLHEFSMDRTEAFMSNINFQEFQCDQPDCTSYFSDFQSYAEHIKEDHKMAKISKNGKIEETFQCEYDGCDRVYSTRSNVVRHIMNKHQDFYKLLMKKQKRPERVHRVTRKTKDTGDKTHAGKENRDDQNHRQKGSNKKQNSRSRSHWTCFGKPSLKSLDEASGMCTKKFALQYPCMLKGCDSVMSSERSVLRHYASHGLTERYIEEQRSGFIFCKKYSRSRLRDSESEDDAPETSEDDEDEMGAKEQGTERSKRIYRKVGSPKLPVIKQLSSKITENKSVETVVIKRKRGRPRKVDNTETKIVASGRRRKSLRNTANKVSRVGNRACIRVVHAPTGQPEKTLPLSSFKPLGFEVSFLQFLEKSAEPTLSEKRKASKTPLNEMPSKRCRTLQQRPVNIICDGPNFYRHAKNKESLVEFRNPLKLKSVKNVKIVVDATFSSSADLLLKQLQEMRPMVILRKWLYS
ncbi:hypothetical protein GJAV_G00015330 [Gymnothorax javanicus]|nr:hypothetical protein GJAV_G00015330 [Gymnothorax javanicus]